MQTFIFAKMNPLAWYVPSMYSPQISLEETHNNLFQIFIPILRELSAFTVLKRILPIRPRYRGLRQTRQDDISSVLPLVLAFIFTRGFVSWCNAGNRRMITVMGQSKAACQKPRSSARLRDNLFHQRTKREKLSSFSPFSKHSSY